MEGKTTIEKLMERGKATGELTTKEISDALEELDFDVDQLNSFYDTCDRLTSRLLTILHQKFPEKAEMRIWWTI